MEKAFLADLDALNSKYFTDRDPNHDEGSSVPLKYTVAILQVFPKAPWLQHWHFFGRRIYHEAIWSAEIWLREYTTGKWPGWILGAPSKLQSREWLTSYRIFLFHLRSKFLANWKATCALFILFTCNGYDCDMILRKLRDQLRVTGTLWKTYHERTGNLGKIFKKNKCGNSFKESLET